MTDLSEFTFDLPEDLIALRPVSPRDAARLLRLGPDGSREDLHINQLAELLAPEDLLVVNNTKVIPAQVYGKRNRDGVEANIALTLHKRLSQNRWAAFAKPLRKLEPGDYIIVGP